MAASRGGNALVPLGMGALVGKTSLGPQLQRAGALHDASRLSGPVANAPASWSACGPPPLWNDAPTANRCDRAFPKQRRARAIGKGRAGWQDGPWATAPEGWRIPGRFATERARGERASVLECVRPSAALERRWYCQRRWTRFPKAVMLLCHWEWARWLAEQALGHSSRGLEHSTTLRD
jgi:hypothetical protein